MRSAAGSNIDPEIRLGQDRTVRHRRDRTQASVRNRDVQLESTATMAPDTGLIRPAQALDLHQRPSLTVLQLVHTEEDTPLHQPLKQRFSRADELRRTAFNEPQRESRIARPVPSGRIMRDLPGSEGAEVTWVGVSGSWRYALPGLRDAVHKEVAAALAAGKSIVTGGALGTDYWATEMALSIDPARLKV